MTSFTDHWLTIEWPLSGVRCPVTRYPVNKGQKFTICNAISTYNVQYNNVMNDTLQWLTDHWPHRNKRPTWYTRQKREKFCQLRNAEYRTLTTLLWHESFLFFCSCMCCSSNNKWHSTIPNRPVLQRERIVKLNWIQCWYCKCRMLNAVSGYYAYYCKNVSTNCNNVSNSRRGANYSPIKIKQ